jgi:hypothetical protein
MFISVRNVSIYIYIYNVIGFLIGAITFVAILSVTEQNIEIKIFHIISQMQTGNAKNAFKV